MSLIRSTNDEHTLSQQIILLEQQLIRRRDVVRNQLAAVGQKVIPQKVTPGLLLTAAGIGVALQQHSHKSAWSLAALLDAVDAGSRLMLTFKPSGSACVGLTRKESIHDA
jgi:hypothetical protein